MTLEVGVFRTRTDAKRGIERVLTTGVSRENIRILTQASPDQLIAGVPVSDTEQPGMGPMFGSVVGGALGAAGGLGAGAAIASLMAPGVGPILAGGLLGASVLGLGGAVGGAAAGELFEDTVFSGLPHDELYVYEDALRQGRIVVFVQPGDESHAEAARQAMLDSGAETIDAAREQFWIGLRSAEQEIYEADGSDFERDEPYYRKGFEAAQFPALRGKSYEEALDYLAKKNEISASHPAFRRGYERGRKYREGYSRS